MSKHLVFLPFIVLLLCVSVSDAQSSADSVPVRADSVYVASDSTVPLRQDTAVSTGEENFSQPVTDSLFLNLYKMRSVPADRVKEWQSDPDYRYANDSAYWKKEKSPRKIKPSRSLLDNKLFQWIVVIAVISLILFSLFHLIKENLTAFSFRRQTKKNLPAVNGTAAVPVNYEECIADQESKGDFRMAIRYLYLRMIASLSEKKFIAVRDSTTNEDIFRALGANAGASEFRFLATAYEYIYYGDFLINGDLFRNLKNRFDQFNLKTDF